MTERWRPEGLLLTDEEILKVENSNDWGWHADYVGRSQKRLAHAQLCKVLNYQTPLGTVSEVLQGIAEGKIVRLPDGWTKDREDRLAYNDDGKTLDEAVMFGANVHLEQMSDESTSLIMDNAKHRWYFSIFSRSKRAKVDTVLYDEETKNKAGWRKVVQE